jgi:MSHA biogenesis protein MshO
MMSIKRFPSCRGFSLIEMIIAITVLGILSASTAVFLRGPIASYFDTERRADLADAGELAMTKMTQEIAGAVPNSVRIAPVAGGGFYLEFLPVRNTNGVRSEGRYRIAGPGNVLNFGSPNTVFDSLIPVQLQNGDWVVVNNYQANTYLNPGLDTDVWAGNTRALYTGPTGNFNILNHSGQTFAVDAPDHHFQVASGPISYVCQPTPAGGTLTRYSGYAIQAAQPISVLAAPLVAAQTDVLAMRLTGCTASLSLGNLRHAGVVTLNLVFGNAGDFLNLYHAIRIESLP